MYRSLLLCLTIASFSQARAATYPEESPIDNGTEIQEDLPAARVEYERKKVDELLTEVKTNDAFAGFLTQLSFRGKVYAVDRRAEPIKPATSGSRAPRVGEFLRDLGISEKARAGLKITVTHEEFNEDGTLKSRDVWAIDFQGAFQADVGGFNDAQGKSHR